MPHQHHAPPTPPPIYKLTCSGSSWLAAHFSRKKSKITNKSRVVRRPIFFWSHFSTGKPFKQSREETWWFLHTLSPHSVSVFVVFFFFFNQKAPRKRSSCPSLSLRYHACPAASSPAALRNAAVPGEPLFCGEGLSTRLRNKVVTLWRCCCAAPANGGLSSPPPPPPQPESHKFVVANPASPDLRLPTYSRNLSLNSRRQRASSLI